MCAVQVGRRGDDHPVDVFRCVRHVHEARHRAVVHTVRIRINQPGEVAAGMGAHGVHMPRTDQPASDDQDPFHITAPICQGTNS